MSKHIALKCTYNDGDVGDFVGFRGICSETNILKNIREGRVWCSADECECKKYFGRNFTGDIPKQPCYESRLFSEWEYGLGVYRSGSRKGEPMHAKRIGVGKIAILTTRFPGDAEKDRKIIGVYKISEIELVNGDGDYVRATPGFRIRLPIIEAKHMYFWDYHKSKGGAKWGSGLFRYLEDDSVYRILMTLFKITNESKIKYMISLLLKTDFPGFDESRLDIKTTQNLNRRVTSIGIYRKYGAGGEGEEHKKLKNYVAEHPEAIELENVKDKEVEYPFPSGDRVDIIFNLKYEKFAVVEIETDNVLPGIYQAIKYKVLRCMELGLPLNSVDVIPLIVAWKFTEPEKTLCRKYGIRYFEIPKSSLM